MRLAGKVAIISGAARGMGAEEARLFAREGARVVIADVLEEEGKHLEAEIQAAGGEALFVRTDVTSEDNWRQVVQATVARFGKLDILVNNAGLSSTSVPDPMDTDGWRRIMEVNATGVFLGTTAVPQPNGTLVATEVHVFPESMRGTGEGHRPFDGPPGSTMTNATVTNMTGAAARSTKPQSTMTNATVATVADADHTRRMTLKYKDGEKVIVVPDDVPVVMVEPGDRSLLVPGAHIIVVATKAADGTMSADRVSVGKNGLIPPI